MIHAFLLFFFICNYADNNRRKSALASHLAAQPAHVDTLWVDARQLGDKGQPLATPVPLKFGPHLTAVELHELEASPTLNSPEFGIFLHQTTTAAEPRPAVPLEHSMLADATVGLWDEGAESGHQRRPPQHGYYGGAASSEVGQKPASSGQCI